MLPRLVFKRCFTTSFAKRNIFVPPDNAAGLEDNEQWLNTLDQTTEEEVETSSTEDQPMIRRATADFDPNYVLDHHRTRYIKSKHLDKKGLMDVKIPMDTYLTRSSPFSHISAKNRPKAENQDFSDMRIIKLRSGKGGHGAASFARDANKVKGPADGGDGGDGGNIYIRAVPGVTSLSKLRQTYVAGDGGSGKKDQLYGAVGKDIVIDVPVGTLIKWIPDPQIFKDAEKQGNRVVEVDVKCTGPDGVPRRNRPDLEPMYIQLYRDCWKRGEGWIFKDQDKDKEYYMGVEYFRKLNRKMMKWDMFTIKNELNFDQYPIHGIDFSKPTAQPFLLMRGGKGGLGNMHFLTNDIRNPRFSKAGRAGLEQYFVFEMKLIADMALIGLPNAGKSTLLRAISKARPRVGHWEFTTLQPTVGTISLGIDKEAFTVADIPGIIKGASENKGMGLDFLRHAERSNGLVFVISLGDENPIESLNILLGELGNISVDKKMLVVATKADLKSSLTKFKKLKEYVEAKEWKIVPCCAKDQQNIEQVILLMGECAGKL